MCQWNELTLAMCGIQTNPQTGNETMIDNGNNSINGNRPRDDTNIELVDHIKSYCNYILYLQ
jgi:actin-related protein